MSEEEKNKPRSGIRGHINSEEDQIAHSIVEKILSADEFKDLMNYLKSPENDNFNLFLKKFIAIATGSESSVSLYDFLQSNHLGYKITEFKDQVDELIEALAELHYQGNRTENTNYLLETGNPVFVSHLNFLNDTRIAITADQRNELKKKFSRLDELEQFELSDEEIRAAIAHSERKRFRERFRQFEQRKKKSKVISIDFRTALRYAAIIILVLAPAIYFINRMNSGDNITQLADNTKPDTATIAVNPPDTFNLPEAQKFTFETKVLEPVSYGYAQRNAELVKITVVDLSVQIAYLKERCRVSDGSVPCRNLDSINNLNGSYVFNAPGAELLLFSDTLVRSINVKERMRLLILKKGNKKIIYLRFDTMYFMVERDSHKHKLETETNAVAIKQLLEDLNPWESK